MGSPQKAQNQKKLVKAGKFLTSNVANVIQLFTGYRT